MLRKLHIVIALVVMVCAGASVAQAAINYHGFYFAESPSNNIHDLPELTGVNNVVKITYDDESAASVNWQVLANTIRQNGYPVVALMLGLDEARFSNIGGARDLYFQKVKKDLSQDSDFIKSVGFIHVLEEEYTLLGQGKFDSWAVFAGKDITTKRAIMKQGLEAYIASLKNYFPNIPVEIVENFWGNSFTPPSNLDILGLDDYMIPTSPLCDSAQQLLFQNVIAALASAKQFGKPVYLVGPTFDDGHFTMLSACQAQWYIDLAKNDAQVIGLDWFLYADVGATHGLRNYVGGPLNYLRQQGQTIVANAHPTLPSNNLSPRGNFDAFVSFGVLAGWAYDADHPSSAVAVHFYVDGPAGSGTFAGATTTTGLRPDVNAAFGLTGNHGFAFSLPAQFRDGKNHTVYMYAIDLDDPTGYSNGALSNSPANFINHPPLGYVDGWSNNSVLQGWAFDQDHPSNTIAVHFYINNLAGGLTFIGATTTTWSRPDVNAAFGITGQHGFSFSIPLQYWDGNAHQIYAYGIDLDDTTGYSNALLPGSPKTFLLK